MTFARRVPFLVASAALLGCSSPEVIPGKKTREPAVSQHSDTSQTGSAVTTDKNEAAGSLPAVKDCTQPTDLVWRPANPQISSRARVDLDRRLSGDGTNEVTPRPDDDVRVHVSCPTDMNNDGQKETIVRLCFNPETPDVCPSEESTYYVEIAVYTEAGGDLELVGVPHRAEELADVQHPRFLGLDEHEGEVTMSFETNYSELPDISATDCRRSWRLAVREGGLETVREIEWCAFDNSVLHDGSQMLEVRSYESGWVVERVEGIDALNFGDIIEGVSSPSTDAPETVEALIDLLHGASIGSNAPVTLKVSRDGDDRSATIGK